MNDTWVAIIASHLEAFAMALLGGGAFATIVVQVLARRGRERDRERRDADRGRFGTAEVQMAILNVKDSDSRRAMDMLHTLVQDCEKRHAACELRCDLQDQHINKLHVIMARAGLEIPVGD